MGDDSWIDDHLMSAYDERNGDEDPDDADHCEAFQADGSCIHSDHTK